MSGKAHGPGGTVQAAVPPIDMRLILSITAALLATACERAPLPVTNPVSAGPAAPSSPVVAAAIPPAAPPPPVSSMPPAEALTDSAITGRISSALKHDPGMAGADVSVNTDNGVVVLEGTVKSHEQTGIASAHAQSQDGVLRVDNHLRPALS